MERRIPFWGLVWGLALAILLLSSSRLYAQQGRGGPWPNFPQDRGHAAGGLAVTPLFAGWYENADDTYTFSFSYNNANGEEVVILPLGGDNFIEPAEYDGMQPTVFPPGQVTGVFAVTVPGEFARNGGRVVWTLRSAGETRSTPGRAGVDAYQLYHGPMAMGSLPPVLRLEQEGVELWGVMSLSGDPRKAASQAELRSARGSVLNPVPLTARVGTPLMLTVWAADRLEPGGERDPLEKVAVAWATHQGPAVAQFPAEAPQPDENGRASTTATFTEPGEYVLRVLSNNFSDIEGSFGNQCCWTNGYLRVRVSR